MDFEDERSRSSGFRGCWLGIDISGAGVSGMLLGLLAIIFYAVGLATQNWAVADPNADNLRDVKMGLFEYCEGDFCRKYLDNEFKPTGQLDLNLVTRTEATAAFATLAMLFSLGSIICVVFGLGRTGYGSAISRAAIVMLISAICGLLACIIFGAVIDDLKEERDFSVGFSLGLAIAAFFFNLIAAGLLTIDSRNLSYHNVSDAVRRGGAGMI